tara:strand:+ start:365 stop:565 length:201 start_codon:yes stop_codon:yes gene_type:complete
METNNTQREKRDLKTALDIAKYKTIRKIAKIGILTELQSLFHTVDFDIYDYIDTEIKLINKINKKL